MRSPLSSGSIWVAVVFAVAVAVASCGQVASTIFDLPQKPRPLPQPTAAVAESAPSPATSAQRAARPAIEATLNPDSALALLPKDSAGDVDWVAAIRRGIVRPLRGPPGAEPSPDMSGFGFDFVIQGPDPMFDARFPHSAHVEWLSCDACHPRIFPYRGAPITMDAVNQGEACGRCHGTVAFAPANCYRCHAAMPAGEATPTLGEDVVLVRRADSSGAAANSFPRARFSHWVHRIRFRCSACHPGLFEMRAGADTLTMDTMNAGRACGVCHNGGTSFGLFECNRCHVRTGTTRDTLP